MIEPFSYAGSTGHILKLAPNDLQRLIARLIMQHSSNYDIFRDGILYIDIADVDPSQPLN